MNEKFTKTKMRGLLRCGKEPKRIYVLTWLLACLAASVATVIGCGWPGIENSVRFSFTDARKFERLPPLPMNARDSTAKSNDGVESVNYSAEENSKELNRLWDEALAAERDGELLKARRLLNTYLQRSADEACDGSAYWDGSRWQEMISCQERRNSAIDQLDALKSLDKSVTSFAAVRAYLEARRHYDAWINLAARRRYDPWRKNTVQHEATAGAMPFDVSGKEASENKAAGQSAAGKEETASPEEVRKLLDAMPRDASTQDNAQYLRAALLYREDRYDESARLFQALAAHRPHSEKREAALFMAARVNMKRSASYGGDETSAVEEKTCAACKDAAWHDARKLFRRAAIEYPRGLYAREARGWLAYLHLRVGNVADALVEYYRLLSDAGDVENQKTALLSLSLARPVATEEDMARVEALLADEPATALTYAYHEIYNYSFSDDAPADADENENPYRSCRDSNQYDCRDDYYRWQDKHAAAIAESKENLEQKRIAAFAARMMDRYPRASFGGGFALRVAQANLEQGENKRALQSSQRALSLKINANERAAALWVEGVAEYRLREFTAARRTLATLVKEYPRGDLTKRAGRLLAIIAEDAGDTDAALEQYLALDYDADAAYFIDVLMTPEQLAAFIEHHARANNENYLRYALGVRYLRAGRYDEARAAFAQVKTTQESSDTAYRSHFWYETKGKNPPDPKTFFFEHYDEDGRALPNNYRILPQWVLRDVKTADDLQRLEQAAHEAVGDEVKAEALYQWASYLYQGSDLVFYNPAAWNGVRAEVFSNYDESRYRAPNEAQTLWTYMRQHESLSRALELYLETARRFPNTRAARDASYTAAICQNRLANFSGYWRNMYDIGLHAGDRMVTYADVRRTYPTYKLPRAENGWEPATRTVNGGAAWFALPKPKPPLTWRAHLYRKWLKAWSRIALVWEQKIRWWFVLGALAACALLVSRLAKHARKLLREQLSRLRRQRKELKKGDGEILSERRKFAGDEMRDQLRAALRVAPEIMAELAFDKRGLKALALAIISHGLLLVLLRQVLQMLFIT